MLKAGAFIARGTATEGAMEVRKLRKTGSAAAAAGIQRWHMAGGVSGTSRIGSNSRSALNSDAGICGGAAERSTPGASAGAPQADAAANPGIPRLHAAKFASSGGSCSSSAVKRCVREAYTGVGAAEACTKAATGSGAGMGAQRSHAGIVYGVRSKYGVGSSSAAKRRTCGVSTRIDGALEARMKEVTGSGVGTGIQLWHRAGVCEARFRHGVGSSSVLKLRMCGASAGSSSAEARTKEENRSAAGAGIHLSQRAEVCAVRS